MDCKWTEVNKNLRLRSFFQDYVHVLLQVPRRLLRPTQEETSLLLPTEKVTEVYLI